MAFGRKEVLLGVCLRAYLEPTFGLLTAEKGLLVPSSIPPALRGRRARLVALTVPVGLVGSLMALPFTAEASPSPDAVIAEVYGGGGNSGASLTHDFIELGNAGDGPFDLTGWSVQYLSGAPGPTSKWQATPLTGAVPAGGSYLIQEAKGTGGDTALPAPDATGTIPLSATSGTVALVRSTTPLTCLTAADCAADTSIKDLVGFGTATVRETSPVTGAGNTTSVSRNATLTDTDDNAADLTATAPAPGTARAPAAVASPPRRRPPSPPTPPPATSGSTTSRAPPGSPRSPGRLSATSPVWSPPYAPPARRAASGSRTRSPTRTRRPARPSSSSPALSPRR